MERKDKFIVNNPDQEFFSWCDAVQDDINDIQKFLPDESVTKFLFGFDDLCLHHLIESTPFTHVLQNENKTSEIIAFVALNSKLNVPSIHPLNCIEWIHNLFGLKNVECENTIFINFWCWNNNVCTNNIMRTFLKHFFLNNPLIRFVIWQIPPDLHKIDKYSDTLSLLDFERIYPIGLEGNERVTSLIVMKRESFIPKITLRLAM